MTTRNPVIHWTLAVGLLVCLAGTSAAQTGSSPQLIKKIQVLDQNKAPLAAGDVDFYVGEDLLDRLKIGPNGYVEIDHAKFSTGSTYKISIWNEDLDEIFVTSSWIYNPESFDPEADRGIDKYVVTVTLQGKVGRDLEMVFSRTLNPAWEEREREQATEVAEEQLAGPPTVVGWVGVNFMFGNFGANADALAGVPDAQPGLAVGFGYRHHYNDADPDSWRGYRELAFLYAQNRYTTTQVQNPSEQSDVTFHNITLAYGLGWKKSKNDLTVFGALALGGVYDGSNGLSYNGRDYTGMLGFGVNGRYIRTLAGGAKLKLGLYAQGELMYYAVDSQDNDHWYGLAPSVAIGVAVF